MKTHKFFYKRWKFKCPTYEENKFHKTYNAKTLQSHFNNVKNTFPRGHTK